MADYTGVVYQEISVDVSEPNQFAPILVAQGDAYTRGLKITMTQHGEKLNIPNTGVTAALNACNMADNIKKASVMAEISSDGTITAIIPSVVMEAAGYVQCDVSVIGSDGSNTAILKSTVFYLNCEASADTDGSSQPPEDDVITAAIASIAGKVDSSVYNQKIGEIEDEIDSIQDDVDSIDIQLSAKANKETTLAGYGITDAYTKSKVEERIDESFELKTLFPNNSGSSDGYLINEVISPGSSGYRDEYCCLFGGETHATGLDALTPENFGESYHIEIFLDNVNIRGIIFQELRTGESGFINYPSAWNVSLSQDEYTSLSGTKIEHDYTMGATTTSIFRMRLRCNGNNLQQVRVRITKNRGLEKTSNKVVTVSEESTDTEYPSAKCLYNALQGCMRYENIDTSVSTSGLDNLTESNTIYDFLYNDIHEKVILLFIDSGKRAESEGQELFLNCTQIMFTQSGKILKRQSDDEGVWGVVINVIPDVSVKVDKYQYLQDLEKIDNSINSKADESKLTAVQASFNIALGFKEANANKVSIIDPDNADDTQYPSTLAVVNYINSVLGRGASQND